jgi:hypothetical protein
MNLYLNRDDPLWVTKQTYSFALKADILSSMLVMAAEVLHRTTSLYQERTVCGSSFDRFDLELSGQYYYLRLPGSQIARPDNNV